MTEVKHIPNVTDSEPDLALARQLQSLLGEALGSSTDPDQALRVMGEALQMRAELPKAQRRVTELEAELAATRAKLPPLEAEAQRAAGFLSMLATAHGRTEDPDHLIGFAMAAIQTHNDTYPELRTRAEAQATEFAELKAEFKRCEPILVMISTAVGCADSFDEMYRVTQEALEARKNKQAYEARLAEIEAEHVQDRLERLIAKSREEHRLTPAIENGVRTAFAAKTLNLESAEFMLSNLPTIAALERKYPPAPLNVSTPQLTTFDGKTWEQLAPAQRATLHREEPALYAQMRREAGVV